MSRFYPIGSTEVHRIPAFAGIPTGGDLCALWIRRWHGSTVANSRHITRREGTGNTWSLAESNGANTGAPRLTVGFSTTPDSWEPTTPPPTNVWLDELWSWDYTAAGVMPNLWINGVAQVVTHPVAGSGTPNTTTADIYIGNRTAGTAPAGGAIAEIAFWRGRLLTTRDANRLFAYGPGAVPRSRSGWWEFDKYGGTGTGYVPSHDGPNPILLVSGTGARNFIPAPPKRKRRWFNIPGGLPLAIPASSTVTGTGSAGEGEGASGSGSGASIAATGTAGEGEAGSGTGTLTDTGSGTAGEGEGIGSTPLGVWTGPYTWHDATSGLDYSYRRYLPTTWTPTGKFPVLVSMPGLNGDYSSGDESNIAPYIAAQGAAFQQICIVPMQPAVLDDQAGWARSVIGELNDILTNWAGDPNRVVLQGISGGGKQVPTLVYNNPGVFAAWMMMAGAVNRMRLPGPPATDAAAITLMAGDQRFVQTPARTWHSTTDATATVPIADDEGLNTAVHAATPPARDYVYDELTGYDHVGTWNYAWTQQSTWDWLYQQKLTIVATGTAGEGEGATGTGSVSGATITGTGSAGEGEGVVGTAAGATITGTGAAGEGESAIGTASGAAVSGSGSAGEGESAIGTGSVTVSGSGSTAGEAEGASGAASVRDAMLGAAGEGESAGGFATASVSNSTAFRVFVVMKPRRLTRVTMT